MPRYFMVIVDVAFAIVIWVSVPAYFVGFLKLGFWVVGALLVLTALTALDNAVAHFLD